MEEEEHGDAYHFRIWSSADHQQVDGRSCTSASTPHLFNVGGGEDDDGDGVTMAVVAHLLMLLPTIALIDWQVNCISGRVFWPFLPRFAVNWEKDGLTTNGEED